MAILLCDFREDAVIVPNRGVGAQPNQELDDGETTFFRSQE